MEEQVLVKYYPHLVSRRVRLKWKLKDLLQYFKSRDWLTSTTAAIVLAVLAIIVVVSGSITQHGTMDIHEIFLDLWSNGGTELASIALTVLVIEGLNRRRATTERKKALILQMGSPDNGFAVEATRILRAEEWLKDGTLVGANLWKANLARADLGWAILWYTNLEGADLRKANLEGADLHDANLEGAELQGATFDENTVLPDSDYDSDTEEHSSTWTPETDMTRFTDTNHPDFWRSGDPDSPAYRGEDTNK